MRLNWRAMRRRMLTPGAAECSLDRRGFHRKNALAQDNLETIGTTFLRGYAHAVQSRHAAEAREHLEEIPAAYRGFAYEGAGMGAAVLDGLPFGGRHHVTQLLEGAGDRHVYMIWVGVGWAMARLPRIAWPEPRRIDPLMRGLVLDGYGFHQAYFRTPRYVHQQYREQLHWPRGAGEATGCGLDQGIGRALWFVGGSAVAEVADLIERFPTDRRADLWAGAGLAATYAGGAEEAELELMRERAGRWAPQLAQASAFAAEARVRAGLVVPHTGVATRIFCGTTPQAAAQVARAQRPRVAGPGSYEAWRRAVADRFATGIVAAPGVRS